MDGLSATGGGVEHASGRGHIEQSALEALVRASRSEARKKRDISGLREASMTVDDARRYSRRLGFS